MTPEEIKGLRVALGTADKPLSQQAFAELVGCSIQQVHRWETSKSKPIGLYLAALRRIASGDRQ